MCGRFPRHHGHHRPPRPDRLRRHHPRRRSRRALRPRPGTPKVMVKVGAFYAPGEEDAAVPSTWPHLIRPRRPGVRRASVHVGERLPVPGGRARVHRQPRPGARPARLPRPRRPAPGCSDAPPRRRSSGRSDEGESNVAGGLSSARIVSDSTSENRSSPADDLGHAFGQLLGGADEDVHPHLPQLPGRRPVVRRTGVVPQRAQARSCGPPPSAIRRA